MTRFEDVLDLKGLSYSDKYRTIVNALGYEKVKKCIPFSKKELKESYAMDEHFNTIITPIRFWDLASGFSTEYQRSAQQRLIRSPLTNLYHDIGVDVFSNSDGVSILKMCAKMYLEKNGKKD